MKRFVLLSLCLAIIIGLTGCGAPKTVSELPSSPTVTATAVLTRTPAILPTGQPALRPGKTAQPISTMTVNTRPPSTTPLFQPTIEPSTPTVPPAQLPPVLEMIGKLSFDSLGQEGNAIGAVAVSGQTALVGFGSKLNVVNMLDPTEPQLMGQSEALPGKIKAILAREGVAYIGAGTSMIAFDMSNPSVPVMVSHLILSDPILHLALQEQTLIAAIGSEPSEMDENGSGMIVTLDVSQPDQPQLLDWVELPWYIFALALANETVYVNHPADATFFAIDISTPNDLPTPTSFPGAALVYSLQAQNNTLYMGGGRSDISAWDISSLAEPQKLWEVRAAPNPDFGLSVVEGFVFAGSEVYLHTFSYHGQITGPLLLKLPEPVDSDMVNLVSSAIAMQGGQLIEGLLTDLTIFSVTDSNP